MRPSLSVAVGQPVCLPLDVARNAVEHARLIRRAGARLVIFPELSLTGYHFDAAPLPLHDSALAPIVAACADADTIALAGAPVRAGDDRYIAMLRIDAAGAAIVYRKSWLSSEEQTCFTPGGGPTSIDIDGWRVGLGICRDTGVRAHVEGVAALDIDLYVGSVLHHHHELDEQDARAGRINRICQASVAVASFAGSTGEGYAVTAGNSGIWDAQGQQLARANDQPGQVVSASLYRSATPVAPHAPSSCWSIDSTRR